MQQWHAHKSCTKRELKSLIGTLHYACTIVCPGRSFLQQAINLLSLAKRPHHHRRLSASFRSDIAWWLAFASQWNGCFLLSTASNQSVELTFDASGNWGCGAWCGLHCFKYSGMTVQRFLNCNKRAHSSYYCSSNLGVSWTGHKVIARCDNESIVTVLNSRYSNEPHVMSML